MGYTMRGLSEKFMNDLSESKGTLSPILNRIKNDHTLMLAITCGYANIYYRGGNILKITERRRLQDYRSAPAFLSFLTIKHVSSQLGAMRKNAAPSFAVKKNKDLEKEARVNQHILNPVFMVSDVW
jgi:hypothetical protein